MDEWPEVRIGIRILLLFDGLLNNHLLAQMARSYFARDDLAVAQLQNWEVGGLDIQTCVWAISHILALIQNVLYAHLLRVHMESAGLA